jgi:ribonuclease HI
MGIEEDRLRKELVAKEELLLDNAVRNDAGMIAELLDANFVEFTSSGAQYRYSPGATFGDLEGVSYLERDSVTMTDLADDCKLLVYVNSRVCKNARIKSNRSSVWKKTDGKWKLVFHQGTACAGKESAD